MMSLIMTLRVLTLQLTGRILTTTHMMARNCCCYVHDESGKWLNPNNILNNWRVTKTCLRLGSKIVGKCMMGSTSNALAKGGANFKEALRGL